LFSLDSVLAFHFVFACISDSFGTDMSILFFVNSIVSDLLDFLVDPSTSLHISVSLEWKLTSFFMSH